MGSIENSSEQIRKVASHQTQVTCEANHVLNTLRQSGHTYFPKILVGAITGAASGNRYQKLGGILAKLVADQKIEIVSAKDARAAGATIAANKKWFIGSSPDLFLLSRSSFFP